MFGWVYILSNRHIDGWVKVGRTENNIVVRIKKLETSSAAPGEYAIDYAVYLNDHENFERDVHNHLRKITESDREWFVATAYDVGNTINEIVRDSNSYIVDKTIGNLFPPEKAEEYEYICGQCRLRIHETIPMVDNDDKRRRNRYLCIDCGLAD